MKKIKGKPVSSGIAVGQAFLFNSQKEVILREKIKENLIENEIHRFNNAVKKTRAQLKKIYHSLQKLMGKDSALIIETQYMLINEKNLINEIRNVITSNSVKTEWAIKQIEKKYLDTFNKIQDLSFREKGNDISDVLNRLINNLKDTSAINESSIENVILVSQDLSPSVAANLMAKGKLLGIILDQGGETSHTVILAKTLEIPTILNADNATRLIANDDTLVLDGLTGEIFINPTKEIITQISTKKEKYQLYKNRLKSVIKTPDFTKDEHAFNLMGNIELAFESEIAHSYGVKGIGLFRTEFLFLDPGTAYSLNKQYLIYKKIAQSFYPNPVVIRTFDIGRDKNYHSRSAQKEMNPALGTMAVRLFLKEQELFKTQIKAIVMANESGNIKLLIPMVTEVEEIHEVCQIVDEVKAELAAEEKLPDKKLDFGIMIEIPGAVKLIPFLADAVDFFSIGTNDLIQYLLAVDRNNSSVADLYSPFHPAVITTLMEIRQEIAKIKKPVTVCGEMAGKTFTSIMLLGMGYTDFSMNPLSIIEVKRIFTNIHFSYVKKVVSCLTGFSSRNEVEEFLIEAMLSKYPDLFIKQQLF